MLRPPKASQVVGGRAQQQHRRRRPPGSRPARARRRRWAWSRPSWLDQRRARRGVEGHRHDRDDDVGAEPGGQVEVAGGVHPAVDQGAAARPAGAGRTPGWRTTPSPRCAGRCATGSRLPSTTAPTGAHVDGHQPQRPIRPLGSAAPGTGVLGVVDGEEAAGEGPAERGGQAAARAGAARTAAARRAEPIEAPDGIDRARPRRRPTGCAGRLWPSSGCSPMDARNRSSVLSPARSMAPTIEPAEVPTTRSASSGRNPPTSSRACRTPAW